MKILLTGCGGQVGFELTKKLPLIGEVIATDHKTLDLTHAHSIKTFIDEIKPDIIINSAAYTAVDKAESESELAYQVNVIAPQTLAEKAKALNIPLVHFSTDYVFDGFGKVAYVETDSVNPQSIYGKTKYQGEEKVRQHSKHIIIRTSWVFGSHGHNFLKNVLKLMQEKDSLKIVSDQSGSPTSSSTLADVTLNIVDKIFKHKQFNDFGTYHVTNEGETNWYEYACFVAQEAMHLGFKLACHPQNIYPILTSEYPTIAKRPLNSRLDCQKLKNTFMIELPHWQAEMKKVLKEII